MELIKSDKPLEFKKDGVTFYIKPRATSHDGFMAAMGGEMRHDGSISMKRAEFNETILRGFIIGWDGVFIDGKPTPYSWESFVTGWPKEETGNIFVELTNFIFDKTDFHKPHERIKKG